jgi:hypothetical protein
MTMKPVLALLLLLAPSALLAAGKAPSIDPDAAYVLVEVGNLENALLKGTKGPGTITLARYDAVKGDVRGGYKSPETALGSKISPRIQLMAKPVGKSKTSRLYMAKVDPDFWVIEGANGTAFSLGSKMFEIKAGQVVDLGYFKPSVDWIEGEGPKSMLGGMMGAALFGSMKPKEDRPVRLEWRSRSTGDIALPAELGQRALVPARYADGAKFGNYLGGLVNRIGGRAERLSTAPKAIEPAAASIEETK